YLDHRKMTGRCESTVTKIWNMICSGDYPQDLASKYGAYMMKNGDPYSVFSMEKKRQNYLVFFRSEAIGECKTLQFVNSTFFRCFEGVGKAKILIYPKSRLTCINHSLRLADELVSHCTARAIPQNEFAAILYAENNEQVSDTIIEHNSSSFFNINAWLLFTIVIISVFLF
ncbi:hypothetical protein KR044_008957, partial [Drosophila immigrans]